jgi:phosphopantothenoylcysteine decarboxylase/phosphopantothenate--cysteine ligase
MGYAIADVLHQRGAEVIMVSGPVSVSARFPYAAIVPVITAKEMLEACEPYFKEVDAAIFTAAVADYRPKNPYGQKMKKSGQTLIMEFVKNPDIALIFGRFKSDQQLSIGFALETNKVVENATKKLTSKNFDAIIINSPGKNEGFGHDTNRISILRADGIIQHFPLKAKAQVAIDIADELERLLKSFSKELP